MSLVTVWATYVSLSLEKAFVPEHPQLERVLLDFCFVERTLLKSGYLRIGAICGALRRKVSRTANDGSSKNSGLSRLEKGYILYLLFR